MHYIYIIQNNINHKVYVGQSINPKKRWISHLCHAGHVDRGLSLRHPGVLVIHLAMSKHGKDNFSFKILEECDTQKEADERESHWIIVYQSRLKKFGYNLKPGGSSVSGPDHPWWGRSHTLESKLKIGKASLGNSYAVGYIHTPEAIKKISDASLDNKNCVGRVPWNKGLNRSDNPLTGVSRSITTKRKIGNAKRQYWFSKKQIEAAQQMSKEGKSLRSIARAMGCNHPTIKRLLANPGDYLSQ